MKTLAAVAMLVTACAQAQNLADVLKQGEQVFAKSCSAGYCHGVRGNAGGAPRLAGRGFDQSYISNVVTRGVAGTGMPPFGTTLAQRDFVAVVAYVATLNGHNTPDISDYGAAAPPALTGEAARGAALFKEAGRAFGRCSTCHEVGGFGMPVAAPIANVPASAAALKALATPNVKSAAMEGESMPALVLSEGKQGMVFYDLTSAPPVQRNVATGSVKIANGSAWRHSAAIGAYTDAELGAILAYLRAVIKP